MKGRDKCELLNEVRQKIAEKNDIEFTVYDCTFEGDCTGTCPKCESEVRYLEAELAKKQARGEKINLEGIFTLEETCPTWIDEPPKDRPFGRLMNDGDIGITRTTGIIIDRSDEIKGIYDKINYLKEMIEKIRMEEAPEGYDPIEFEKEREKRINEVEDEIKELIAVKNEIEREMGDELLGDLKPKDIR